MGRQSTGAVTWLIDDILVAFGQVARKAEAKGKAKEGQLQISDGWGLDKTLCRRLEGSLMKVGRERISTRGKETKRRKRG